MAVISGAHGVRGGLKIKLHDPASDALRKGLVIELASGQDRRAGTVASHLPVPHQPRARLFLEEVTDRDEAERLRGWEIRVRRGDLPPLGDDEFYLADTIGLRVRQDRSGSAPRDLGVVVSVVTGGAQDMLEVEHVDGRGRRVRWLLPVLPHFIREVDENQVTVELPGGIVPEELDRG